MNEWIIKQNKRITQSCCPLLTTWEETKWQNCHQNVHIYEDWIVWKKKLSK